MSSIKHRKW